MAEENLLGKIRGGKKRSLHKPLVPSNRLFTIHENESEKTYTKNLSRNKFIQPNELHYEFTDRINKNQ